MPSVDERIASLEKFMALQEYKTVEIQTKLNNIEHIVQGTQEILQQVKGGRWVVYGILAVFGAVVGKTTGIFSLIWTGGVK